MKKPYHKLNSLLFAAVVGFGLIESKSAQAQSETPTTTQAAADTTIKADVFELSLEDLLNMPVTVSSKKEERLADAPGSITAYSSKDIEKLGYYTLADLASITPGYSAPKQLNVQQFETRGQYTSGGFDNNKHVVLIDGIPVYNARANMAPSDEMLPLLGAQRVEFLRGPGSALYGISAFNGVINVLTKDMEENGTKVDAKMSLGNYDMKKRVMLNVVNRTDKGIAKISAGYYGKESTMQYLGNGVTKDELSKYVDYSTSYYLNSSFKLTDSKLKGLSLGTIYQKRSSGLGEWWMDQQNQTYPFTESQFETFIPYLKYERKLSNKWSVEGYLKKNLSSEKYIGSNGWQAALYWSGAGLSAFKYSVNETEFKGEARYKANERFEIIGGVNYLTRYGTGAPQSYIYYVTKNQGPIYNYSGDFSSRTSTYNIYSVFGQAQYKVNFLKGLIITAGARMDMGRVASAKNGEITTKYDQLSPRIALVQKLTDAFNLKLMYGKALRAPMIKEVGGNEEAKAILERDQDPNKRADAANVPQLKAETIDNFEAAITFNKSIISASGTVFQNITNDALYRGQTPGVNGSQGQAVTQNIAGKIVAKGFEVELQVAPIKNIRLGANFASAIVDMPQVTIGSTNQDTIAGGRPFNTPTNKVNGTLTYSMFAPVKINFTLIASCIQNYNVGGYSPWRRSNPGGSAQDFNTVYGGQNLFDLNITGEITSNLSLELQVRNLTNQEYRTPAFFASRQLNVPGAGRSFLATVSYKF